MFGGLDRITYKNQSEIARLGFTIKLAILYLLKREEERKEGSSNNDPMLVLLISVTHDRRIIHLLCVRNAKRVLLPPTNTTLDSENGTKRQTTQKGNLRNSEKTSGRKGWVSILHSYKRKRSSSSHSSSSLPSSLLHPISTHFNSFLAKEKVNLQSE